MTAYVLMVDMGYDGDALLGVYSSRELAVEAARSSNHPNYELHVLPVAVDHGPVLRWGHDGGMP